MKPRSIHKKEDKTNRSGVEDTRIETKAKDTKEFKAIAKDSPSQEKSSLDQGQEGSRPRSFKNSVLQTLQIKKVFKNFFRRFPK